MHNHRSPLRGLRSPFGTGGGFNPAILFANNEQGIWLDPSDFSTMFQDDTGTMPVTAVGQPVGLALDKSQRLALGPELVTNGNFSNGPTGWAVGATNGANTTNTVTGGQMVVTSTASVDGNGHWSQQTFNTVPGRYYVVTARYTGQSGTTARFIRVGGTGITTAIGIIASINNPNAGQVSTLYFFATAATTNIAFGHSNSVVGGTSTWDDISIRELAGNHARQGTAAARPTLQQDGTGRFFLLFDGVDDFLQTGTITPGTDKAQVFAGVRKLSDAAQAILAEWSTSAANAGAFSVQAPGPGGAQFRFASGGSVPPSNVAADVFSGHVAPVTRVLTGIGDIAADTCILRLDGAQVAASALDQGTGNFTAQPMFIGRRNGLTLAANIRIYQLITRFGSNLPPERIAQVEAFVNARTGAF